MTNNFCLMGNTFFEIPIFCVYVFQTTFPPRKVAIFSSALGRRRSCKHLNGFLFISFYKPRNLTTTTVFCFNNWTRVKHDGGKLDFATVTQKCEMGASGPAASLKRSKARRSAFFFKLLPPEKGPKKMKKSMFIL